MSEYVKEDCPSCGRKASFSRHITGYGHCWSANCLHKEKPSKPTFEDPAFLDGQPMELKKRLIPEKICAMYDYKSGIEGDELLQIANYRDASGAICAQKHRNKDKHFKWVGKPSKALLFGQHLFRPADNIDVIITEGEIDALSVATAFNGSLPAVSIRNGIDSAPSDLKAQVEWLSGFRSIVLCFDNDGTATDAIEKVTAMFEPGRVKVAVLPLKDANAMLVEGRVKELTQALYRAQVQRPDSILTGQDLMHRLETYQPEIGYSHPFTGFCEKTKGLHKGRMTLFTAPTGGGKSLFMKELAIHLVRQHGLKIGSIFLEESVFFTAAHFIGIYMNKPAWQIAQEEQFILNPEYKEAVDALFRSEKILSYDHFGSIDGGSLLSKIEFLAVAEKVDFIILDHISIVVSGLVSSREGERKDIDILMTQLRSLIQRTGVGVLVACHINRGNGQDRPEEGGRIRLTDLRGSSTLEGLSDFVVAIERDQQAAETQVRHKSRIRVLKNRLTGELGVSDVVLYNPATGRLDPMTEEDYFDEQD